MEPARRRPAEEAESGTLAPARLVAAAPPLTCGLHQAAPQRDDYDAGSADSEQFSHHPLRLRPDQSVEQLCDLREDDDEPKDDPQDERPSVGGSLVSRREDLQRETSRMAMTAIGGDLFGPQDGVPGCSCCGDRTVAASLLRLGEHPEVGVCFRCVRTLTRRKREIERQTRAAPIAWPLWRRVLYRAGLNRC